MKVTPNGIPILELDEIGSTNVEAMRLGLAGETAPLWVRAVQQTAGRGRSGRPWASDPGNLYASLLLRLECAPAVVHQLSFVSAVATVAALRKVAGEGAWLRGLALKWPNDILVDGAKLVGILPESTLLGREGVLAVIGIGINLTSAPGDLGRATTHLAALGTFVTVETMLNALASAMDGALAEWQEGTGFATIRTRWLADAWTPGVAMTVHIGAGLGQDVVRGTFVGLDDDGALILRDHSGYDRRMTFGDVTLDAAQGGEGNN